MKIINTAINIAMLMLITSCANTTINHQDRLIGIWGNSDDNGKTIWGYDEFLPDGTTKSWGTSPVDNSYYEVEGAYKITGNNPLLSCITVTKSSNPKKLPVGDYWCNEIVSISEDKIIFKNNKGIQHTLYKQEGNVKIENNIDTFISCRSEFYSSPTNTVSFHIKILKDEKNNLKSFINGELTNNYVTVSNFIIRPDLDLQIDPMEAFERKYNEGEMSLLYIEGLSTDRELSLDLNIPFDLEKVSKVVIYSLVENDETKIYGGTNIIEAYDSEGRLLGRVFHSLLLNGCF